MTTNLKQAVAMVYSRTQSGIRAWKSTASGLPAHYRRILDVLEAAGSKVDVATALPEYSYKDIDAWMDELETLAFLRATRLDRQDDQWSAIAA